MGDLLNPSNYTAEEILSDQLLTQIYEEEDELVKTRNILAFQDRAKLLGVVTKFNKITKAYDKKYKVEDKKLNRQLADNYTDFDYFGNGTEFFCGNWIADADGVKGYNLFGEVNACYHPILPVERLKNLETGEEHIKIAYKRNGQWFEVNVQKDVIASASKIVSLSKLGVSVTSENAKHLVKYLSDIENWNDAFIPIQKSTSKLGWNKEDFIPFDDTITFDGDTRFKSLFESIHEYGDYDIWLNHVRSIRARERIESKMMLASSFSSALVGKLGVLPYFVDLWGETEGGKSVSLMLACSVWANPDESQYIGDFKTTDVALEARADMLNSFPMMLDDTSKVSSRIRDNFEGIVYDLCSGKGKSRSNKELGVNRENRWKMCILTNGERPLSSYVNQGGAINRIIEVECESNVYESPQETAELLKKNYGFAGRMFVEIVKNIPLEELEKQYKEILEELYKKDKMQKQTMSMALVLLADRIATERIFKDGQYISMEDAERLLTSRNVVSDNERCYEFLMDKIYANEFRFDSTTNCEKWGIIENGYAYLYSAQFNDLCESGGYSKKAFLSWASKRNLIQEQNGKPSKVKKINGTSKRCICLKLEDFSDSLVEFQEVENEDEIPFK